MIIIMKKYTFRYLQFTFTHSGLSNIISEIKECFRPIPGLCKVWVLYGVINKPCGQSRGRRGVSKINNVCQHGEGGVRGLSTWAKMFYGSQFLHAWIQIPFWCKCCFHEFLEKICPHGLVCKVADALIFLSRISPNKGR